MSFRPRDPGGARNAISRHRMAPGGRAKPWSQSPIPRVATRRVRVAPAPVAPVPTLRYWWKFDEASGDFADSMGNAGNPLTFITGGSYSETALTGTGSAFGLDENVTDGSFWFHPAGTYDYGTGAGFGPDATGCIGIDFWVSGLRVPAGTGEAWFFQLYQAGYTNTLYIQTTAAGAVEFKWFNGSGGTLHTHTPTTLADTAHIRWDIDPTTDTSRAYWDGALISEDVGSYSLAWGATTEWHLGLNNPDIANAASKVIFDELKIYGIEGV